ncbi:hypothetical protein COLO4_00582, partial [Corchorus olitorius]
HGDQLRQRVLDHFSNRHMYRGQRRQKKGGHIDVIETHQRDILRQPFSSLVQRQCCAHRHIVITRHQRAERDLRRQQLLRGQLTAERGPCALDDPARLKRQLMGCQRLLIASQPRGRGGRARQASNKRDILMPALDQIPHGIKGILLMGGPDAVFCMLRQLPVHHHNRNGVLLNQRFQRG